ncbi:MAG: hypothetical protein ACRDP1_00680 [Nocardioidaceae bacterium]
MRSLVRKGSHGRSESGTALIEFIWLGLILMVPLVYALLAVFDTQRAAYGVSAAARSAGRAFVLAPDQVLGEERARQAAQIALADQGVELVPGALVITCRPEPTRCLSPGSLVTVTVSVQEALPLVPRVLGGGAPSVRVSASHTEPYGTFREDRSRP